MSNTDSTKAESLTTSRAAAKCGVHYTTIRRWILEGKLPAYETPGGHLRIPKEDLDNFITVRRLQGARRLDAPLRILVVDDDEALRDSLLAFFAKDVNFDVRAAADGFSAGRLVAEFQPDVIILDLLMPGINGFEVCRNIRNTRRSMHTKILVLTGYATEENIRRAKECGANICLAKPIELDLLKSTVAQLAAVKASAARA
jgi:excisionase family DNA binding protein